jgi:hypothetical protein
LEGQGTIIAGNSGASPDVDGAATDLDNNLIGDDTGSTGFTVSLLVGTQLNPIPPLLDSLHSFGMTGIHVPQWGSFAIDRGAPNAPFDDQRRANRLFGGTPDIGAVEFIVNQRPSFTAGNSVKVKGDGDNHTVQGWATAISAGAQWEAGQELRFVVSGPRGAFESGPSIDPETGNLRFRPEKDEHGTFVFEVALIDDGGTANGGDDTSTTRQLVIELERDEDDPFGADCSASTRGGLPIILAGAGGLAAILRRRKTA